MVTYQSEADALAAIQAHPLCADMLTTPTRYAVFYPPTYRIPGGVAVQRGMDDLAALNLLYERLQDFWNAQRLQIATDDT
jgi:hypothetical protein